MKKTTSTTVFATLFVTALAIQAEPYRVVVKIENTAPMNGTFQTPIWVGFHEGEFDTYNGNTPANSRPRPGSLAMESLCEDGDTGAITDDFAALSAGIDATLEGPDGPIAPGVSVTGDFVLDSTNPDHRYFSYASMIIPSNDFCISNGNPLAHPVFDDSGDFIASNFFVTGSETLDAGTEVNDEVPENTAFFGQTTANTGQTENGNIGTLGSDITDISGFLPTGNGGILDDRRFRMADFSMTGYSLVKISFEAAPAIAAVLRFRTVVSPSEEVPPVDINSIGVANLVLVRGGTELLFQVALRGVENITAAHLHLAPAGINGPVVAPLLALDASSEQLASSNNGFIGKLVTGDLLGPLEGRPLDALISEILAGNVYVNIHSEQFPAGQLRGQVSLNN